MMGEEEESDNKIYFSLVFQHKITEDMNAKIINMLETGECVFAPAYIKDNNGNVRIIEISVVKANK